MAQVYLSAAKKKKAADDAAKAAAAPPPETQATPASLAPPVPTASMAPASATRTSVPPTNSTLMSGAPASMAPVREERECPFCAELILKRARVCKHCRRDVEPLP